MIFLKKALNHLWHLAVNFENVLIPVLQSDTNIYMSISKYHDFLLQDDREYNENLFTYLKYSKIFF